MFFEDSCQFFNSSYTVQPLQEKWHKQTKKAQTTESEMEDRFLTLLQFPFPPEITKLTSNYSTYIFPFQVSVNPHSQEYPKDVETLIGLLALGGTRKAEISVSRKVSEPARSLNHFSPLCNYVTQKYSLCDRINKRELLWPVLFILGRPSLYFN